MSEGVLGLFSEALRVSWDFQSWSHDFRYANRAMLRLISLLLHRQGVDAMRRSMREVVVCMILSSYRSDGP